MDDRPELYWGREMEDLVARRWSSETGLAVGPTPGQLSHPDHPWMLANIDRTSPGDGSILECKTARTAEGWGPSGSDEIPLGYAVQVTHQMCVFGCGHAHVAVLIAGSDFRRYVVHRDEMLAGRLVSIEAAVWSAVLAATPPEPDWRHPDTPALIARLHRPEPGVSIGLDARDAMAADEYESIGRQIKALERVRDKAKSDIIVSMGAAAVGVLPDGRRVTRRVVPETTYTATRKEYTDFRLATPGGRKRNETLSPTEE